MSNNYLDYDISKVRKGDSKLRIRKTGVGTYLVATVIDGEEDATFEVDSKDMPTMISANVNGDAEAIIKEIAELPVTLTLVEG